ncbi:iron chelate uptake ABC transporter family permease subunit [Nocardia farcinica]|uniref:iron chelate uptake ABC transporter family permease subunit n=1 Tax=Nocardia farcinica TaxID=37329 RepID=UPI003CC7EFDF
MSGAQRPLDVAVIGAGFGGLGMNIARSRALGFTAVVLLSGAATSAVGPIAFLGLVPVAPGAPAGPAGGGGGVLSPPPPPSSPRHAGAPGNSWAFAHLCADGELPARCMGYWQWSSSTPTVRAGTRNVGDDGDRMTPRFDADHRCHGCSRPVAEGVGVRVGTLDERSCRGVQPTARRRVTS